MCRNKEPCVFEFDAREKPVSSSKRIRIQAQVAFGLTVLLCGVAITHEGHAPLPTKGVEVDLAKGLLTLSPEAQTSLGMQTAAVELRTLDQQLLGYANLVTPWQKQHFLTSQVSGRIVALHVNSGELVEAGQVLAELESPELERLQLELRNAVRAREYAQQQVQRLEGLARDRIVAGRELIEALTRLEQDKIAVDIAMLKLGSLGFSPTALSEIAASTGDLQPRRLPLVSNLRGSVTHADLSVGKIVSANEHLFEINDISTLWVKIGVLEKDLAQVRVGQTVDVEFAAIPEQPVRTRISVVGRHVDAKTHVATVWAEIANDQGQPRFFPGMYGTAKIITSDDSTLLTVPRAALLGSGAERYVLVETAATEKGHEFRKQSVAVTAENSTIAQIREGAVYPGDRVVSRGGQVLSSLFVLGSLRLSPEGISNVGLKVEPAAAHAISEVLNLDGMIDLPAGRLAHVSSPVPGTLRRLLVDRDQDVVAGQVIAEVAGIAFLDAQLDMLRADRELQLLNESLQRLASSGEGPVVAARRIWEIEAARDAVANRKSSAQQVLISMGMVAADVEAVLQTGRPRETLPLRSPINGSIVAFDKVLGEQVSPEEIMFEVHDLNRVWARGFLSEREAAKVRIGSPARVRVPSYPGLVIDGTIVRSSRWLGESNRTLEVWIEFETNREWLLPRNLLARVSVSIGDPETDLAVPTSAIVRDGMRHFIFVQKEEGLLERRHVELGRADDQFVVVRSGLTAGELVAVQGSAELQTTYAAVR